MAVRSAHHAVILGHSDDAHAHLGGVIRNIPNPLLGQVHDTHMLIIILQVAILGADVVSELAIKIIPQLHFPFEAVTHLRWASFLLRRLTANTNPS